jgi:hypothetical protein
MVESWEKSGSEGEDVFGGGGNVDASTSLPVDGAQMQIPIQSGLGGISAYDDDHDHDHDGQLRSPPALASEEEEPSIETLLSQSIHPPSKADPSFSPSSSSSTADPSRDKDITIKRVSDPSHPPSSSSAPGSVSVPVLFHNGAGDAFVDASVRRVSGGSSVRSVGSIVGWNDDDEEDEDDRGAGGRSTMKHLPVPPANDNREKGGSVRSHTRVGTGSRRGMGREERRVVTAIFSAEPPSGAIQGPGGEAGLARKTNTHADEPEATLPANVADLGYAPAAAAAEITTHDKDLEAEQLELDVQRVLSISRGSSPWLLDQPQPQQPQPEGEDDYETVRVSEELERARENESQLGAELEATRILAGAFRKRLEEVERKIADMEIQHQRELEERTKSSSPSGSILPAFTAASSRAAHIGAATTLVTRALSYIYILPRSGSPPSNSSSASTSTPLPPTEKRRRRGSSSASGDPPVSALPTYVLLVGIGVCAVVLRVVLRRAMRNTKA